MHILAYIVGGLRCVLGVALLWIADSDRRYARQAERQRQKLIARALKGAER